MSKRRAGTAMDREEADRLWGRLCAYNEEWRDWHTRSVRGDGSAGEMPWLGDKSVAVIKRAIARARKRERSRLIPGLLAANARIAELESRIAFLATPPTKDD